MTLLKKAEYSARDQKPTILGLPDLHLILQEEDASRGAALQVFVRKGSNSKFRSDREAGDYGCEVAIGREPYAACQ